MAGAAAISRGISAAGRIRIVLKIAAMVLALLACLPLYYLFRPFRIHNPIPRFFMASLAWLAGIEVSVSGERTEGGEFIIANHVSWIDILAIGGGTGSAFVAHDGLASVPLIRWLCAMNDTVFVSRTVRNGVSAQVANVREAIRETGALTIFPEGTTSDGLGLLPFKSSLLSALDPVPAGVAVQPVLIDFGEDAPHIAWIGEEHGLANFLRILARARPVRVDVHFLPPLSGGALTNRKTMAAASREAILGEMQARRGL
ncbi:MAG: lysophospholipid acyltransferase family protein [Novosphingobium sp.]